MTPHVAVIVVNYNAGDHLARCLESLVREMASLSWEAIVVDNGSVDGSERCVSSYGPRAQLVPAGRNLGFGRAVNLGVAHTQAQTLLLLNPDGELRPHAVETLIGEMERFPSCAVIGPRIVNDDGSMQGNARGDPTLVTGLFGRSSLLTRLFPHSPAARRNVVRADESVEDQSLEVDWVSGACMLVRRGAFEMCGGFDEGYFLYWEDADLCRRLRRLGYTVRYAPRAEVRHTVGGSSRTARRFAIRAFHRSAFRYYSTYEATSWWDPARSFAAVALFARCLLRLLATIGPRRTPAAVTTGRVVDELRNRRP
jgi:N-acetylglucosaminyl-diphospho-decaprenol L-rhamnosyltransferase